MRTTICAFVAIIALSSSSGAQQIESFSISGGLAVPKADAGETQDQGFLGRLLVRMDIGRRVLRPVAGIDFALLPGRKVQIGDSTASHDSRYLASLLAGLQVGGPRGVYLLPALSMSFGSLYSRPGHEFKAIGFGLDLSAGVILPLRTIPVSLDIAGRLGFTNLLSQSIPEAFAGDGLDLERLLNVACLSVGVSF